MKHPTRTVAITLPNEVYMALKRSAETQGRTMSEFARTLIMKHWLGEVEHIGKTNIWNKPLPEVK